MVGEKTLRFAWVVWDLRVGVTYSVKGVIWRGMAGMDDAYEKALLNRHQLQAARIFPSWGDGLVYEGEERYWGFYGWRYLMVLGRAIFRQVDLGALRETVPYSNEDLVTDLWDSLGERVRQLLGRRDALVAVVPLLRALLEEGEAPYLTGADWWLAINRLQSCGFERQELERGLAERGAFAAFIKRLGIEPQLMGRRVVLAVHRAPEGDGDEG